MEERRGGTAPPPISQRPQRGGMGVFHRDGMGAAGSPGAQVVGPDHGHQVEQNAPKKLEARVVEKDMHV